MWGHRDPVLGARHRSNCSSVQGMQTRDQATVGPEEVGCVERASGCSRKVAGPGRLVQWFPKEGLHVIRSLSTHLLGQILLWALGMRQVAPGAPPRRSLSSDRHADAAVLGQSVRVMGLWASVRVFRGRGRRSYLIKNSHCAEVIKV